VVEGARLESVYTFIAYRGFESPSVRQISNKNVPIGAIFIFTYPKAYLKLIFLMCHSALLYCCSVDFLASSLQAMGPIHQTAYWHPTVPPPPDFGLGLLLHLYTVFWMSG